VNYATVCFSHHISRSHLGDNALLDALGNFFSTTSVLFWIEHLSRTGNLENVIRTATDIGDYLTRCSKCDPNPNPLAALIRD